jgi:hypothetical protein
MCLNCCRADKNPRIDCTVVQRCHNWRLNKESLKAFGRFSANADTSPNFPFDSLCMHRLPATTATTASETNAVKRH